MIWVVDASVAVRWFLAEEADRNADWVLDQVVQEPGRFCVPELFAFEVFSVLERLHPEPARVFLEGVMPILQSGILRHPMTGDLAAKADRFVRLGLTGYDACYVALAEEMGGVWLTFDKGAHDKLTGLELSCLLSRGLPENRSR
ncbi:MAG: type II toxin-antitoxin system VapC family toxin [Acidobacteriota bacterium]